MKNHGYILHCDFSLKKLKNTITQQNGPKMALIVIDLAMNGMFWNKTHNMNMQI